MLDKKSIAKFQIFSGIFVAILGTVLHFTYEWSDKNVLVGVFSAVNESTWEHLKLLFFPMLITTIIGYFYLGEDVPNFLCAKTIGIIIAILFTVTFFYTYSGILGRFIDSINILSFFVAVILGEYVAYRIMISNFKCKQRNAIVVLSILSLLFIIFTFTPPKIGLFKDPIANDYGIGLEKSLILILLSHNCKKCHKM